MTLDPNTERELRDALDQVRDKALDIPDAGDLDTFRQALCGLRQAILYAAEVINDAEREARKAALANLARTFA